MLGEENQNDVYLLKKEFKGNQKEIFSESEDDLCIVSDPNEEYNDIKINSMVEAGGSFKNIL